MKPIYSQRPMAHASALLIAPLVFVCTAMSCVSPRFQRVASLDAEVIRPPLVRVRVAVEGSRFTIRGDGRFILRTFKTAAEHASFSTSATINVDFNSDGLRMFDGDHVVLDSGLAGLWIHAINPDNKLWINGQPYYGALVIGRGSDGWPMVVNRLNLDTYLSGVLAPELGERSEDEFEAVKAQAVASRTYSLARLGQYANAPYDLRADVGDQIYVGASEPREWIDRAVVATQGEVLAYEGHLIDAYYHSTCGGRTDAIEDIWSKSPRPYLLSVDDDTACNWSKYTAWTERFDEKTLLENLRKYRREFDPWPIPNFDVVNDIRLVNETPGGRNCTMMIVTPGGEWRIVGDDIRRALGRPSRPGAILPSARFTLDLMRADDGAVIGAVAKGSGYGHGVGMCQCGMIGRARAGETYQNILMYYYPGACVERVY